MTENIISYEIKVDIDGFECNDVAELSVFRCPFIKTASFTILKLSIPTSIYIGIETECKEQNFLPVKITIMTNDASSSKPSEYGETKNITTKIYKLINIELDDGSVTQESYITASLYLVNPILYYLSTTNSYNKILEDKSGLELLEDFEKHLSDTYGEKAFKFKKIKDDKNINEFKYEQLLVRLNQDLLIPTWILQNYSPFNSFSFYFFDDFVIDNENTNDIVCYLINLNDKNQFKKVDCLNNPTYIAVANKYISTYILNDTFNILDQVNPSKIICGSDIQFKYKKADGQTIVDNIKTESSDSIELMPDESILPIVSTLEQKSKQPTEQTILYSSADIDTSIKKLKITKKQLKENLDMIIYYYLRESHPHFFQFGKVYNLDPFNEQGYFYTPISLVNIFKRMFGKVPLLTHHLHYQVLKFN